MKKQKHHIIPKHAGGTNSPDNIILLSIPDHAEAHRLLYEQHRRWQDKLAWRALSGYLNTSEIRLISQREGSAMGGKIGGKLGGNKAKKDGLGWHGFTKEKRRENGLKTVAMKTGIHAPGFDKRAAGEKGGNKCKNEGIGFCGFTFEERSRINKGTIWIHKGKIQQKCRMNSISTFLSNGWTKGRVYEAGELWVDGIQYFSIAELMTEFDLPKHKILNRLKSSKKQWENWQIRR